MSQMMSESAVQETCITPITDQNLEDQNIRDEKKVELTSDPYAYLDRCGFSSEKFKIEIRGLPKFYGIGELKKLLNSKLQLGSNKIKPPKKRSNWLYVCFRSDADRQAAIVALNGHTWKGSVLQAFEAKPAPDPLVNKRNHEMEDNVDGGEAKKLKVDDEKSLEERLRDSTTPLWNVTYCQQLEDKQKKVRSLLLSLSRDIVKANPTLAPWIKSQKAKHEGLPCELLPIRPSPVQDGYRNKCEFTVGLNEVTGEPTVGFRVGSYVRGFTGVGSVDCLKHVPQRMKEVAKLFEQFVRQSDLGVYNPETQEGNWRQLTVRLAHRTSQLMLIVGIHPQSLPDSSIDELKTGIRNFFQDGPERVGNVSSLYLQLIKKTMSGEEPPPLQHILGETHVLEELSGLRFRVSPQAFFQVNTPAAEVLYGAVAELAAPAPGAAVLDVCCGTGTIGLSLAQKTGQVLGIELSSQAVADAKENAALNQITNCEFFEGRAEDIMGSVISRVTGKDILATVDPPRPGLHQKALIQLRRAEKLKKLVFMSCDPKAAFKNFVDLARSSSKTFQGLPFVPVRAVAVDMFPHTVHCELVVLFERLDVTLHSQ
ncbi:tRNA (uracil-5-)-methyltransferase homolog A-like [Bacillus rossius redtenbacheri]|uniref:tRNA (uracil-5-)-methyltransferase homolog A-like n=1 Tax=Bacillus rossius redtenbacheri TaxID=93214 RepID=UPI002FDC7ECE